MATFDLTQRSDFTAPFYKHSQEVKHGATEVRSAIFSGADAATFKGSAVGTGDVYKLTTIPAGALVLGVSYVVTTQEGATSTFNIGDGGGATTYVTGANGNAATNTFVGLTTNGIGKYYATADSLLLALASGTAAVLAVKVSISYVLVTPVAV